MGFLLDTNVLSELIKSAPNSSVIAWIHSVAERSLFLSVLTLGEIRKGIELAPRSRRAKLERWLASDLKSRFQRRLLPVDAAVAERWGMLAAKAKQRGEVLPPIDGLLAATAIQHGLVLVTRNLRHVQELGAQTMSPWSEG